LPIKKAKLTNTTLTLPHQKNIIASNEIGTTPNKTYGKPGVTKDLGVQFVYNLYKSQLDTKLILFYIKKVYEIRKRLFLLEKQLLFYTHGFLVYNIRTSKVTTAARPAPIQLLERQRNSQPENALRGRCSRNIAFRLNNSSTIKPWFQNIQKDTTLQAKIKQSLIRSY
jgi:hypothetical protein